MRAAAHGSGQSFAERVIGVALLLSSACACDRRAPDAFPPDAGTPATGGPDAAAPPAANDPLEVRFLGVEGFLLTVGDQTVMTAPLYTRPSMFDVEVGTTASDGALVRKSLPAGALDHLVAVVTGHAHYDHLLDVPELLRDAPSATLYANASARHLLAALAPDRDASCAGPAAAQPIARSRVFAFDDAGVVDWRQCPADRPDGASATGKWVRVPGARVRLYATCSAHPDQVGPYHFGPGSVDADQCELPTSAGEWREGRTLSVLIDFLDENDRPRYRVYYQDAPTGATVGTPPADVLADKAVDLALLCVGNYDRVDGAPEAGLAALGPRFALGGHWEDFFRPATDPPQPLPFTDVNAWTRRAQGALPPDGDGWLANGKPAPSRALLAQPGDRFTVEGQR